jgi:hypothetical protein
MQTIHSHTRTYMKKIILQLSNYDVMVYVTKSRWRTLDSTVGGVQEQILQRKDFFHAISELAVMTCDHTRCARQRKSYQEMRISYINSQKYGFYVVLFASVISINGVFNSLNIKRMKISQQMAHVTVRNIVEKGWNRTLCFVWTELGRFHRRLTGPGHVLRDDEHRLCVLLARNSTVGTGNQYTFINWLRHSKNTKREASQ